MESSIDYYEFMNKCSKDMQKFLNDAFGFYRYLSFTKSHSIDDEVRLDYSLLLSSILNQDLCQFQPYNYNARTMIFNYFGINGPKSCYDDYERKTIFNLFLMYFDKYTNQDNFNPQTFSIELIMLNVLKNENVKKLLKSLENKNNPQIKYELIVEKLDNYFKEKQEEINLIENKKFISSLNAPMQQYLHIALYYYANLTAQNKEEISLFLSGIYLIDLLNEIEKKQIFKYFNLTSNVSSISYDFIQKNIINFQEIMELINIDETDEYQEEFLEENGIYVALYKLLSEFPDCFFWLKEIFDENYYMQLMNRLKRNINLRIEKFKKSKKEVTNEEVHINENLKLMKNKSNVMPIVVKQETKSSTLNKKLGKYLNEYGIYLNEKNYRFNPAVGREKEIKNLKMDLLKSKSIILIGEAGVGKTAIVNALANDLKNGNVPDLLMGMEIVKIDIHSLIAGTKYRGDFEERVKNLINDLQKNPQVIIYIEELHTVKGLGDSSNSSYDFMNMLKPYLSNGDLKIIGDTTIREYDKFIAQDAAFSRRFVTEVIEEPSKGVLKEIIIQKIIEFTNYYNIKFDFDVATENLIYEALIDLTNTNKQSYFSTRKNPDLIIDALENIFVYAAYYGHREISYNDVIEGMNLLKDVSDTYKKRVIYELQKFLQLNKQEGKSRVIKFPSLYSLK